MEGIKKLVHIIQKTEKESVHMFKNAGTRKKCFFCNKKYQNDRNTITDLTAISLLVHQKLLLNPTVFGFCDNCDKHLQDLVTLNSNRLKLVKTAQVPSKVVSDILRRQKVRVMVNEFIALEAKRLDKYTESEYLNVRAQEFMNAIRLTQKQFKTQVCVLLSE